MGSKKTLKKIFVYMIPPLFYGLGGWTGGLGSPKDEGVPAGASGSANDGDDRASTAMHANSKRKNMRKNYVRFKLEWLMNEMID